MSKVIWKFNLQIKEINEVELPICSQILTVQSQFNEPCLWVLLNPNGEKEKRKFQTFGTGHEIDDKENRKYIGTYQTYDGNYVYHLFEIIK